MRAYGLSPKIPAHWFVENCSLLMVRLNRMTILISPYLFVVNVGEPVPLKHYPSVYETSALKVRPAFGRHLHIPLRECISCMCTVCNYFSHSLNTIGIEQCTEGWAVHVRATRLLPLIVSCLPTVLLSVQNVQNVGSQHPVAFRKLFWPPVFHGQHKGQYDALAASVFYQLF
jgi:hypothetical protein